VRINNLSPHRIGRDKWERWQHVSRLEITFTWEQIKWFFNWLFGRKGR